MPKEDDKSKGRYETPEEAFNDIQQVKGTIATIAEKLDFILNPNTDEPSEFDKWFFGEKGNPNKKKPEESSGESEEKVDE